MEHSMSTRIVKVLPALIAIAGFALAGCSANKKSVGSADGKPARMVVINTTCPIEPDDTFDSNDRPAELVRTVNGQNIGFCCDHCTAKFDKMSEEKKAQVLAAAKANKGM
jgi:hypothetical protein